MSEFVIKKEVVLQACKTAAREIFEERERLKQEAIDEIMKRKWFKPKTREAAWEAVSAWRKKEIKMMWCGDEKAATFLFKVLPLHTNDTILLGPDDARFVCAYYKEKI